MKFRKLNKAHQNFILSIRTFKKPFTQYCEVSLPSTYRGMTKKFLCYFQYGIGKHKTRAPESFISQCGMLFRWHYNSLSFVTLTTMSKSSDAGSVSK